MAEPQALPPIDLDDSPTGRILAIARQILLRERYSGLTMDALAFALGMSKKTIYAHFASKEEIVAAIIAATGATIRRQAEEVFAAPTAVPEKLEALLGIIAGHFGALGPDFLQDLQRYAPTLAAEIDRLKDRNIPIVIGRILALGVADGLVRADVEVDFLVAYWLQIIKGVHDPAVLSRAGLTPREAFEKAVDLFFRGILTSEGRAVSRWADTPPPA